jgi:hypothetical protein
VLGPTMAFGPAAPAQNRSLIGFDRLTTAVNASRKYGK